MKLVLGSDLHSEFEHNKELPPLPDADLIILAGDIGYPGHGPKWLQENTDKPAIFVAGNHDYYGSSYQDVNTHNKQYDGTNVMVLTPGIYETEEYVFIACTLWSSLRLPGYRDYPIEEYKYAIQDFTFIKGWTPEDHVQANLVERQFIIDNLEKYKHKKCVLITHFVPTVQCITEFFRASNINPYFINDLDFIIDKYEPVAWLFGHTHTKWDQLHTNGKTRLICNPRGYPGERAKAFKWKEIEL